VLALANSHLAYYAPPPNVTPFYCTYEVDLRMGDFAEQGRVTLTLAKANGPNLNGCYFINTKGGGSRRGGYSPDVGLYKMLFHFKALLWSRIILLLPPPPTCNAYPIAIPLHDHCAIYALPPTPHVYTIHHTILVTAISCEGQETCHGGPPPVVRGPPHPLAPSTRVDPI